MIDRDKILLKDVLYFDELLSRPEFKGKRIKLRFNKNWEGFDFVEGYRNRSENFIPWILSRGSDKKSRNQIGELQFQFIEVEYHRWLFVGAYLILDKDSQVHTNGVKYANSKRLTEFDKFSDKLLLDWKNRGQSWFYTDRGIIDNIEIYSISSTPYFERIVDFPGFENLSLSYSDLKQHFYNSSWQSQLSSVYGVYVITDILTGKLYVGSACGDNGIYGRWSTYLADGYDKSELESSQYPNKQLKKLVDTQGISYVQKYFQYSILEIFSKNELGKQKALTRETYWKKVLQSREHGYNDN